jgi:hypothetical protein
MGKGNSHGAGDVSNFQHRTADSRAFDHFENHISTKIPLLRISDCLRRAKPQRVKANVSVHSRAPFAADPLRLGSAVAAVLNPQPLCP